MIGDQIRQFIVDNYVFDDRVRAFGDDDSFLDSGFIDSTGVLELVMFVEETFNVEVSDEDVVPENFDSVNNLVRYLSRKTMTAGRET
jgi:acyl carrier protein